MSLNHFTDVQKGKNLNLQIGCNTLNCTNVVCANMQMPNGADLDAHNVTVEGVLQCNDSAIIGGVDYNTPDIGQPNYSLHTDGLGATFWSPDDTGSGDIAYNGVPPTINGQLLKFSSVDGSTTNQSIYTETTIADNITDIGNLQTDKLNVDGSNDMTGNLNITDGVTYQYNFQYGQKVSSRFNNSAGGTIDIFQKTRGTKTTPTAVLNNDVLYTQFYEGHNGTSSDAGVLVRARCTEDWSVGNAGTSYTIQVNNTGTDTLLDKFIIGDNIQMANGNLLMNNNGISDVDVIVATEVSTDTINEKTGTAGVNVDGVLCKDNEVRTNDITALFTTRSQEYLLNDGLEAKQWSISVVGGTDYKIANASNIEVLKIEQMTGKVLLPYKLTLGAVGNDFSLPNTRPVQGELLRSTDAVGTVDWTNIICSPMGEISFGTGLTSYPIPLPTVNVWYNVANASEVFTSNNTSFYTAKTDKPVNGRLRYIGTPTTYFHVSYSASAQTSTSVQTYQIALSQSGSVIPSTIVDYDFANNDVPVSIDYNKMVQFATNAYVEVVVRCTSTSGTLLEIKNSNLMMLSNCGMF